MGDLLAFSNGINADKSAYGSGVPFANVLEVITHDALRTEQIPGRITVTPKVLKRYEVKYGDVLLNRTSETQEEVGLTSVYLGDEPIVFGGFVFRGRPITDELTVSFSKYAFRSPVVRRQIVASGQGGIRSNIGQRDLKSVLVPVPPRPEQESIAGVLDDMARLVSQLERLVAKKRDIKHGLRQELLTGRVRLPGFTDEWRTYCLRDLGTFLKGRGIKRNEVRTTGVPCVRYGELYTAYTDYTSETVSFVDAAVAAQALPIRRGDVLFAGSGETKAEIGTSVAYVGTAAAVAGGDVIVLRGNGYDPIFLGTLLNTPAVAAQKARVGQGDAVVHIHARTLAEIEVTVPNIEEQTAIAQVAVDADAEIAALERRLAKARAVRHGMMHELLTGQTRLPAEGAAA